jgi:hypothetical protein
MNLLLVRGRGCKLRKFDASLGLVSELHYRKRARNFRWICKQHITAARQIAILNFPLGSACKCVTKDLLKVIIDSMFYTSCLVIVYANLPPPLRTVSISLQQISSDDDDFWFLANHKIYTQTIAQCVGRSESENNEDRFSDFGMKFEIYRWR